jgi:hypothetical protein
MSPGLAQEPRERSVEDYLCRDIMRDSGADRDVAIAFLHGVLLGRSGSSRFDRETIRTQTEAFIDRCLNNPTEKAIDAMAGVKK